MVVVINVLDEVPVSDTQKQFYILGFVMIYYGLGLLVLLDFLTLGVFKKIRDKTVSTVYFYIYRFYSLVSISFIFRPILLNFIDNRYTRRLFFLAIPYTIIMLFAFKGITFDRYVFFPSFSESSRFSNEILKQSIQWNKYDDLRVEHNLTYARNTERPPRTKIHMASLSAYEIEENAAVKLFLEYQEDDGDALKDGQLGIDPFRKKQLGFSLLGRNTIRDSMDVDLSDMRVKETRIMRESVRKSEDRTYSDTFAARLYEKYTPYDENDIEMLENEIEDKYEEKRQEFMSPKLGKIKERLKTQYRIKVDSQLWNDNLECSFYIHPNMHERGLLCYFSTDSLSRGSHVISIKKKRCSTCNERTITIPFRIVK